MHALLTLMFHPIHPVPLAQLLLLVLVRVATHPVQSGHSAGQQSLTHARTPSRIKFCPCKLHPGGASVHVCASTEKLSAGIVTTPPTNEHVCRSMARQLSQVMCFCRPTRSTSTGLTCTDRRIALRPRYLVFRYSYTGHWTQQHPRHPKQGAASAILEHHVV